MDVTQLVEWTAAPSLAISSQGTVLALNSAYHRLAGPLAQSLIGGPCSEAVKATDGERSICVASGCPTLESLAAGRPVSLHWQGCALSDGPVRATTIAIPAERRTDDAVAVIVMHVDPEPATPEEPPARIRVHLFGRPESWLDDKPQLIRRRRVFEVVALLALAGEAGIQRDRIVSALWPDAPPGNGRQHLRVLLHALRAALGPDVVESVRSQCTTDEVIRLAPEVWVDLAAFRASAERIRRHAVAPPVDEETGRQRLQEIDRALALYRGELDEGGHFGEWSAPHRAYFRDQFLGLLVEAVPLAASLGEVERAVEYCRRAIACDPLDEGFQVALLTAYGYLGKRAAAIAQYREYRRLLAREFATEPSPAVERALREAINELHAYK